MHKRKVLNIHMKYNLFKEKTTQSANLMVNRDRQLQAIPTYYIFYYTIC